MRGSYSKDVQILKKEEVIKTIREVIIKEEASLASLSRSMAYRLAFSFVSLS